MAIAFDATSTGSANASSVTVAHTVTGSNPFLFVVIRDLDNLLTGVTYASVAMTQIGTTQGAGGNNVSLWYLVNPATGTNNIVATKSAGVSNIRASGTSYTGVSQGAPEASTTGAGGAGTTFSQSVTTITDNAWVVWGLGENTGSPPTAGANTTSRITDGAATAIFDAGGAVTPAGSKTLNASTAVSADAWGGTIVSIAPAAATVALPFRALLGVGI